MLTDKEKENIKTLLDEYVEEKTIGKIVARWLYRDILEYTEVP